MIIKVCGLRDPENIRAVMGLGADMIGLVFDRRNPRYVSSIPSNVACCLIMQVYRGMI